MTLSEVMTPDPKVCRENDSIQSCARIMADNNLGFLPVVDENGILIGTVTDRDITIRATAKGKSHDTKVRDVYSDNPVHLRKEDALALAEDLMMDAHIRRLVVVDDAKKPIGVVSASDVGRCEKNTQRVALVFGTILKPMPQGRTVEELVGSSCCG